MSEVRPLQVSIPVNILYMLYVYSAGHRVLPCKYTAGFRINPIIHMSCFIMQRCKITYIQHLPTDVNALNSEWN